MIKQNKKSLLSPGRPPRVPTFEQLDKAQLQQLLVDYMARNHIWLKDLPTDNTALLKVILPKMAIMQSKWEETINSEAVRKIFNERLETLFLNNHDQIDLDQMVHDHALEQGIDANPSPRWEDENGEGEGEGEIPGDGDGDGNGSRDGLVDQQQLAMTNHNHNTRQQEKTGKNLNSSQNANDEQIQNQKREQKEQAKKVGKKVGLKKPIVYTT